MSNPNRLKAIWFIVIFSVLVNLVAWVVPLLGGSLASPGPGFILWGTAPSLVSLLMRAATQGWSDLGFKRGFILIVFVGLLGIAINQWRMQRREIYATSTQTRQ